MASNENEENWNWRLPHQQRFEDLLEKGFQSDMTLVLGPEKEELKVHKLILTVGSRLFFHKLQKCGNVEKMEFPSADSRIFKMMLKYLYTGDSSVSMADVLPLLKLATEFEIEELRNQCAAKLNEEFSVENVLSVFQTAMEYAHKELITSSLEFICKEAETILDMVECLSLRLECLIEIIQQDRLLVKDEMQVFDTVYKWGLAECERQNLNYPDDHTVLQKILNKPLKHVRFPLMNGEEFALSVATRKVLSQDDVLALVLCFLVSPGKRSQLSPMGRFSSVPRIHYPTSFVVNRTQAVAAGPRMVDFGFENLEVLECEVLTTPSKYAEKVTFDLTALKRSMKLTKIVFHEKSFDGFEYGGGCGYKHHARSENLKVKVNLTLNDNDLDGWNDYLQYESLASRPTAEEGVFDAGECNVPPSYSLKNVHILEARKSYKLNLEISGSSYCVGYNGIDRCTYSAPQYLKLGKLKDLDSHEIVFHDDDLHTMTQDDIPFKCVWDSGQSGFIKALKFDFV